MGRPSKSTVDGTFATQREAASAAEDFDALVALVQQLVEQVRAHELRLTRLEGRQRVHDDSREAALLALAASVEFRTFTARSAVEHAKQADPELLAALKAAGVDEPRTLGRWLRTLQEAPLAGFRVERLRRDGDGALWIFRAATD